MGVLKKTLNLNAWSRLFSDANLTKKASLNAVAAGLDYGARLLIGFLITPALVSGLGDYQYGLWQVLGRLTGYLTAASGRPTQTLKWTLANMQHSLDYEEKRRDVGSAVAAWLIFTPLILSFGGLLIWFIPMWLDVPPENTWTVRVATGVLVIKMALISLVALPQSALEGENLGYKRMGLSATLVMLGGGFTVLALYLNTGLVGVATATLVTTLLTGLFYLQVVRSQVPWFGIARPTFQGLSRFLGLSWWFLVWRLVMQLMMASDVVLLGIFASVDMVTSYSLTKYVPETLVSLVAVVVFGITPGLGGIIGSSDLKKARRVRSEIMAFTWLIATILGAMVLLWNEPFVRLWVGTGYYSGAMPNLLIMVMTIQFVLIRNDANVIDLTLNLPKKVLLGVLSVTLSTAMAIGLMRIYDLGIIGLVLGSIAGRLILSLSYPLIIGRFLNISLGSQFMGAMRPTLVTLLVFSLLSGPEIFFNAPTWLVVDSWLGLIFSVGASFVGVSAFVFFAGLSGPQRSGIINRVQRLVAASN